MGWGDSPDYEPRATWRDAVGLGLVFVALFALAIAKGLSKGAAVEAVHKAGRTTPVDALYRP